MLSACAPRGAVPLGLALALAEELPTLQGIQQEMAEPLAAQLLALIFLLVLLSLLLQSGLMRLLAARIRPEPFAAQLPPAPG